MTHETPTYPGLAIEQQGAVRIMTLDRPDAFNALDDGLTGSLLACFEALHDDAETRVVILRANGRHFCAGVDLKDWEDHAAQPSVPDVLRTQKRICRIMKLMRSCPQPVIALGHGAACGGGFSLMLAADVRYGTPDLRMNAAYVKIGLGGADMGSSYLLPRLVGASLANELLLTGRFLRAERALRVGLLSEVAEAEALLDAGLALARDMVAIAPLALRLTKEVLALNMDAPSFDAAVALEDRQQVMLATTADHREAVAAFLAKRDPMFVGR
jgi:enoyl-CoA hydratase/carnithine racemase